MTPVSRVLAATAGALALSLPLAPAAAAKPFPGFVRDEPAPVTRVLVAVPVDDTTNEILQMEIAAAVGAALAAAGLRVRRRHHAPPHPNGPIPMG